MLVVVPAAVPLVRANKANKSRLHAPTFLTTRRYSGGHPAVNGERRQALSNRLGAILSHVHQRSGPVRRTPREALLTARRPELQLRVDHLREVAQGRDEIRTECAGTIAGSWFGSGVWRGEELIAAGLLMLAGPVDLDELDQWMRVGWERRRGTDVPYGPIC